MNKKTIIPIILCGGIGTRLWPLSRASFPKQFLSLLKDDVDELKLYLPRLLKDIHITI